MLIDLERALVVALSSDDPVAALDRESMRLPAEDRDRLARIDRDGLRLTALIVAKLRFERIARGDDRMREWFRRDPERFTEAYRAYVREVPPTARFPRREAVAFRSWCARKRRLPEEGAAPI